MNLPNKLTMLRIILIPVFVVLFEFENIPHHMIWATVVFALAAITDQLDGHLARKNNQVTSFGKLADPLADKLLTISALICFVEEGVEFLPGWVVILIIGRELIVTGIRMIALTDNTVIAASIWGKAKTVSQLVTIIAIMVDMILADFSIDLFNWGGVHVMLILIIIMVVLTLISGVDYVKKNWGLLNFK
ncbi:MAG: CDP-diacylglycerol--glycerol-3-phosphate 3-phosphatidyltransferase [Ruminococcaceae bacterium]|nr:CDP-diacylglycerol--glycerol-3-phosphate 3-phosphatidyltransferase [Oscillospiraceae bacterium]